MTKKRFAELKEIASLICNMDPKDVRLESANWLEKQGCKTITECCLVRGEVFERKGWIA